MRAEKLLCDPHHRLGEVGIVRTPLDGCLILDERLVLPIQIESGLDRDRAACARPRLTAQRMCEAAHLSSGIGGQCEAPFDAISRDGITRHRLETPVSQPAGKKAAGDT